MCVVSRPMFFPSNRAPYFRFRFPAFAPRVSDAGAPGFCAQASLPLSGSSPRSSVPPRGRPVSTALKAWGCRSRGTGGRPPPLRPFPSACPGRKNTTPAPAPTTVTAFDAPRAAHPSRPPATRHPLLPSTLTPSTSRDPPSTRRAPPPSPPNRPHLPPHRPTPPSLAPPPVSPPPHPPYSLPPPPSSSAQHIPPPSLPAPPPPPPSSPRPASFIPANPRELNPTTLPPPAASMPTRLREPQPGSYFERLEQSLQVSASQGAGSHRRARPSTMSRRPTAKSDRYGPRPQPLGQPAATRRA